MSLLNRAWTWMYRRELRGRHRLYKVLADAMATPPLIRSKTKYGAQLLLDPYEYVDGFILRYGFYESEVFEALKPHFAAGGVFWDIGSNTGLHGVSAKLCFPNLDVVCFEPVPVLANRILENARLNQLSLTVFASALGRRAGSTWITVTPGNLGMSHAADQRDGAWPSILSATQSADELISSGQLASPTVVKIDTEGSEASILSGMTSALGTVRAIVIEAGPDLLDSRKHPLRCHLDAAGFHLRRLVRVEPTSHNLDNYIAER